MRHWEPSSTAGRGATILMLYVLSATVDWLVPPVFPALLAYLVPVSLATWYWGAVVGLTVTAASAATWYGVSQAAEAGQQSTYFAELSHGLSHFLLYTVIVLLISRFRTAYGHEQRRSRTDRLTGLLSRAGFEEAITTEFARSRRYRHAVSVVYFDLDNFKQVNDTWGHETGDTLLREVGAVLRRHLRRSDLAGRLGGDEFGLLLTETDAKAARPAVESLRQHLMEEIPRRFPVSFSIGVASYALPPETSTEALDLADRLMYEAKRHGKDRIVQDEFRFKA